MTSGGWNLVDDKWWVATGSIRAVGCWCGRRKRRKRRRRNEERIPHQKQKTTRQCGEEQE